MTRASFSFSTPFIRLVSLIICYSLFAPIFAFTAESGVIITSGASFQEPIKGNVPLQSTQAAQKAAWRDGELLVRFRKNSAETEINALMSANEIRRDRQLRGQSGIERLRLPSGSDPLAVAATLRSSQLVDFAEPNYLITADQVSPDDPRFPDQWSLKNTGVGGGQFNSDINASRGWELTTGSVQTVIAVLDSGIDFTHPDLRHNEWNNSLEQDNNLDDDDNGFVNDRHGWDFITESNEIKDVQGHGTAVAGIIAAQGNNATGITGVMWRAGLMSLRVLDDTGTGDVAGAIEAFDYATSNGAQVINCSWGTDGASIALLEAINRAARRGVIVVVSAGNDSRDIEKTPRYPASFNLNNLITVASTDNADLLATWSNRGATHLTIAAPGTDILTTKIGGDYQSISGSSASAPLVSGVTGLIKTLRPWLGAERTREIIIQGARKVPSLSNKVASGSVVDAAGALEALNTLPPTEGLENSNGNNGNDGNNGGDHTNNGQGRSDQRGDRPGYGNGNVNDGEVIATPLPVTPGTPGPGLPNLDELRRKQPVNPKAVDPIPSTRCSHKDLGCISGKSQAAIESPLELLALGQQFPELESLLGYNSPAISDSPFQLFRSSSTLGLSRYTNNAVSSNSASYLPPPPVPGTEDVIWTNAVGVSVSGNSLTKTAAVAWGNAGASSTKSIAYGDGYVEFTASETNTYRMVGLSNADSNQNYTDITYAIYPTSSGTIYIDENGVSRGMFGTYATGNKLRVAVEGGVVKYYKDSTLLYTSTLTPSYPLLVDTSLYNVGSTVTDAVISGMLQGPTPPQNVTWTNVVGATASGNDLTKTATTAWGNAGAVSTQTIPYGEGYFEFIASENNTFRMVGLGTGDSSQNYADITYAFYMYNTGVLHIYENGTDRGLFGTYTTGDRFRILVQDGVTYWKNGALLYTSTVMPTYPLLVDTALYNTGATITDVTLSWDPNSDPSGDNFSSARLDPLNGTGQPGVDLLSRNASWSVPILGLTGRASLDLGLSLSYNSLVWTKSQNGTSIKFDADRGMPSPGFRLGFPVIQPLYYNSQTGANAYLLITPSGTHVELRQVGTTNVYEAADSSYLHLTDNGSGSLTLTSTDGSQLSYSFYNGQYQCGQIKDRNGNFITVTYHSDGRINTIKDTLARIVTFNYDAYLHLISITQIWSGVTHTWATFGWGNHTISTGFSNQIVGPQNGTVIPVLTQVSLDDGSRYNFEYNGYAQVNRVRHYAADNHQLAYTSYTHTLPTGANDCPKVTETKVWAENWNSQNGVPAEVAIQYSTAVDYSSGQMTMPDGSIYKELFATTGWQKGLTTVTENWSSGVKKKWTTTSYTQDNTALLYQKNPRPIEANIYDTEGNRKRKTISYTTFTLPSTTSCSLPSDIYEYSANATSVLRRTHMDYRYDSAYLSRRIIGLLDGILVYDGAGALASKVRYDYDWPQYPDLLQATPAPATQHDAVNYGQSFCYGRGNKVWEMRYDVTDPNNSTKGTDTIFKYYTTGSMIYARDPSGHALTIGYTDSFSDAVNRNTFAYPTTVTDADSFASTVQYKYEFGGVTRTQSPTPAGQTQGAIQTFEYDTAGRTTKINNVNNGAHRRWVYDPSGTKLSTYSRLQTGAVEAYSASVSDGLGRVRASTADNPNSTGGYKGQYTYYDLMGRAFKQSNLEETNGDWVPTGDDAAGWVWTQQQYDWKGRPTITTNPDGTTKEMSYGGCGCAGGEVVTVLDEGTLGYNGTTRRQQKMYSDVLGRPFKTQALNWDGTVYSTTLNTYNARDQITNARQYQGTETSGIFQESVLTYDGHGRLLTSKAPEQTSPTSYTYNADDTTNVVTDARGATTTFGYNNRHLTTSITHTAPSGVTNSAPVTYSYDAAGNRTGMTDGMGSVTYQYNQLSQLTSETRSFTGVGSYTLTYGYNLAGALTSVTDDWGVQVGYGYDHTGRLTGVTGSGGGASTYASNLQYRAWGALKHLTYGNNLNLDLSFNNRLQTTKYDLKTQANVRVMGREYQYTSSSTSTDNDGRVKYSKDLVSSNLDRTYTYDHVGRLQSAKAGVLQQSPGGTYYSGPFEQSYSNNVWGNLTGRGWRTFQSTWTPSGTYTYPQWSSYSENYVNNRNTATGWQYDANGSLLTSTGEGVTRQYTYDSAGMMLTSSETGKNITQGFDGDGQRVKFVENSTTTYYVRSSVLGGQTITEVDQSGTKKRGYVHARGMVIAKQEGSQVLWDHSDVSGVSRRLTNSSGTVTSKVETDPLGTQVDDTANYNYSGGGSGGYNPMGFYGTPQMPNMGCSVQSVPTPCSMATHMVNVGMYKPDQVLFGAPGTNGSLSGFGGLANIDYRIGGRGNPSNAITSHGRGYAFENGYLWMNDQTPSNGDGGRRGEFVDLNRQQNATDVLVGGTAKLKTIMEKLSTGCKDAVSKLINKIASDTGIEARFTDPLDLFNDLTSQTGGGGVYIDIPSENMAKYLPEDATRGQVPTTGGSGLAWVFWSHSEKNVQRISVIFRKGAFNPTPHEVGRLTAGYIVTAIHELTHVATKDLNKYFEHEDMDRAAQALGAAHFDDYVEKKCISPKYWSRP
jgi:YD repeat-containing protein